MIAEELINCVVYTGCFVLLIVLIGGVTYNYFQRKKAPTFPAVSTKDKLVEQSTEFLNAARERAEQEILLIRDQGTFYQVTLFAFAVWGAIFFTAVMLSYAPAPGAGLRDMFIYFAPKVFLFLLIEYAALLFYKLYLKHFDLIQSYHKEIHNLELRHLSFMLTQGMVLGESKADALKSILNNKDFE